METPQTGPGFRILFKAISGTSLHLSWHQLPSLPQNVRVVLNNIEGPFQFEIANF